MLRVHGCTKAAIDIHSLRIKGACLALKRNAWYIQDINVYPTLKLLFYATVAPDVLSSRDIQSIHGHKKTPPVAGFL